LKKNGTKKSRKKNCQKNNEAKVNKHNNIKLRQNEAPNA
jgi:hypothetical protein